MYPDNKVSREGKKKKKTLFATSMNCCGAVSSYSVHKNTKQKTAIETKIKKLLRTRQ